MTTTTSVCVCVLKVHCNKREKHPYTLIYTQRLNTVKKRVDLTYKNKACKAFMGSQLQSFRPHFTIRLNNTVNYTHLSRITLVYIKLALQVTSTYYIELLLFRAVQN